MKVESHPSGNVWSVILVTALKDELKKRDPFDSVEQEAMLAVMRTSDLLENRMARLLRENGLTLTQYNVLRILRGEGQPMPCLEVANRMIQVAPAITRVVDQLLALDLITKTQASHDRRVFEIELTPSANKLLKKLDQPVLDLHAVLLSNVSKADLKSLIRILEVVRAGVPE
ncbi:MAG: MarR family transcriptional regulator [Pirellulales bacterium]